MKNKNDLKIFIDFDGTITTTDVGEAFFLKFGNEVKAESIIKRWLNQEINATEMWTELCDTVEYFSEEQFDAFMDTIEFDEAFMEFVDFCNYNNLEFTIVSDGFDIYIRKLLNREGLSHIKSYSNKMEVFDGKLKPVFPFTDEECLKCANCKRNRIIDNSSDEEITLFIGDGWSDTCAVQFVDYILAKGTLLKFCEKNRISYFPYNNFHNVIKRVDELINKKRLKKRNQAALKRKEVYKQG